MLHKPVSRWALYGALALSLSLVVLGVALSAGAQQSQPSQKADNDADGHFDGDEAEISASDRVEFEVAASSARCCDNLSSEPYPYCNNGSSSALTHFRSPVFSPPTALLFLTQTPGNEDVVYLDPANPANEVARCCPANHMTLGAMASNNGRVSCNLNSVFVGNVTTGAGSIFEIDPLGGGLPTSTNKCSCPTGGIGDDNIACAAGTTCPQLRQFTFAGLTSSSRVEALAVMVPTWSVQPQLAVSTITRVHFVDPSNPSCTATTVNVTGTCQIFDGTTLIRPFGMTAQGDDLIVGDPFTRQLYRVRTSVDPLGNIQCTVIAKCKAPGAGNVHGVASANAPSVREIQVLDQTTNRIYRVAGP